MRDFRATIAGTGDCLLERVESAVTIGQRFRGLMLRKELPPGYGLLLPDCRSVHTCFMRFPIDLIYLSADNQVVRIVAGLKSWRVSVCTEARSVLETPAGWAQDRGLKEGDTVLFAFAQESDATRATEQAPARPQ